MGFAIGAVQSMRRIVCNPKISCFQSSLRTLPPRVATKANEWFHLAPEVLDSHLEPFLFSMDVYTLTKVAQAFLLGFVETRPMYEYMQFIATRTIVEKMT